MEEERGASLRLLYQIKLASSKMGFSAEDPDEHSMTNMQSGKMHTILKNKQDATIEMTKPFLHPLLVVRTSVPLSRPAPTIARSHMTSLKNNFSILL